MLHVARHEIYDEIVRTCDQKGKAHLGDFDGLGDKAIDKPRSCLDISNHRVLLTIAYTNFSQIGGDRGRRR
jgi:hypothetical protein